MKPFYEEGKHFVEILDQGLATSTNKHPQLVLKFRVLGKPDPKDPHTYEAYPQQLERHYYRVLNENTMGFALEELKTLGFNGTSFSQLDPRTPNFCDLRGKQLDMICLHKPDQQNAPREEWSIPKEGLGVKQVATDDEIRKLDYQFGKRLKEISTGGMKSAPRPQGVATPSDTSVATKLEIDDSDLPF